MVVKVQRKRGILVVGKGLCQIDVATFSTATLKTVLWKAVVIYLWILHYDHHMFQNLESLFGIGF